MTRPAGPRLRADADQNRRRLLEVARAALDADGDATMKTIAKAAGVGQGTIYRHFPTRGALLVEVYRDDFTNLLDAAATLGASHPPLVALRAWLDELAEFGRRKHALAQALDAATQADLHHEQYDQCIAAIDTLLQAGVDAGEIRDDARADEVLPLASFLWHLDTTTDPRVPRLLDLVVDAVRVRAATGNL